MAKRPTRARSRANPPAVAFAWYDAAQWAKLKQLAADADNLDDTHEAWQRNAENVERQLRRRGLVVRRVWVDVDALAAWCQARQKPLNGASRSAFAAEVAAGHQPG